VVNYRGDKILFGYPARSSSTNDEVLAYSMLNRNWEHYTGIRFAGTLCPKNDVEFDGASMLYGDPKLYSASAALDPVKWSVDGARLCDTTGQQAFTKAVSDGMGGAIVVWWGGAGIYAQRVNSAGEPQWTANGVLVYTGGAQTDLTAISDGEGGVIVVWCDGRSGTYKVYAQRLDVSGTPLWTANGIMATTGAYWQYVPSAVSDGDGGVIIAWQDTALNIYAQRLGGAAGARLWLASGLVVCTATGDQRNPRVAQDGAGGAFIAWTDARVSAYKEIYAQRVSAAGTVQWTANGLLVCTAANARNEVRIISDDADGAIVSWYDGRGGAYNNIYAQRINSAGAAQWAANGVVFAAAEYDQSSHSLIPDGAGGAIAAWLDARGPAALDVYSQRLSSAGVAQWGTAGVRLGLSYVASATLALCTDGANGAIVAWGVTYGTARNLYAQWISSAGAIQWEGGGVRIRWNLLLADYLAAVNTSFGNMILAWSDGRISSTQTDIYTQRLDANSSSILPGYRVWSLFDGEADEAAFDLSGGIPIPIMFETPEYDAGEPDMLKSVDRLQIYTKQGKATFSARIQTELGSANVSFAVTQTNSKWGGAGLAHAIDTLTWNQGQWAGTKPGEATTGIPPGTLGKRCKLTLWADAAEKVVLLGHSLDFQLLPERPYV
jgi:hypothetical protein